jgi:threo-3-hydroxy-L-aspartate ammonia-lyase
VPVIELDDVTAAFQRVRPLAHRTPLLQSRTLGENVFLKAECFQRTGSFKFRGAYNKLCTLPERQDVIAYSSGNHAQAVALAARLRGVNATIVMPEDAPTAKLEATRGYGAEVITYDRWTESREEIGAQLAEERGLALVKPYDDPAIMAGQGTLILEVLSVEHGFDTLVVPVSGGGLIAGCATALKALEHSTRAIGVEPAAGDDHARSKAAGERVRVEIPRTIADGLGAPEPGELTWEVNSRLVDEFVSVDDEEIVDAMRFLFDRLKIVVEPSGAVGVAALLQRRIPRDGKILIVISGGNVGADRFAELIRPMS